MSSTFGYAQWRQAVEMDILYILAAISSIAGMLFSAFAAILARSASKAASAARDAALVRSLADELQLACSRGEQLVDFLQHCRYSEARLRVDELTWSLSELPYSSVNQTSEHVTHFAPAVADNR